MTSVVEQVEQARTVEEAAGHVAHFAAHRFDADAAGIVLLGPHDARARLAATVPALARLDADLVRDGRVSPAGPVPDDGSLARIDDTLGDRRWPHWSRQVADNRLRSVLAAGMPSMRERRVVLELYSRRPGSFVTTEESVVTAVATHTGLALRQLDRLANLQDAISTRAVIGQAQGILMERYGLTSEQAMAYLRRTSQESQHKVRDLAQHLVAERDRDRGRSDATPLDQ